MRTLFWNVDTQYDFMRNDDDYHGLLPIAGAKEIEGNLERITELAKKNEIRVINTADWHTLESREIKAKEYPAHCLQNTKGADYVPATKPEKPYTISWQDKNFKAHKVIQHRNIVLYKDEFDIFHQTGGPHTKDVLDILHPDQVFVYGVATNVCVNDAVNGLLNYAKERKRNIDVFVIKDAIKELPAQIAGPIEPVYTKWKENGAKFTTTKELEDLV